MRPRIKIGDVFGRLTVVSRAENNKYGAVRWNCACICGGVSTVYAGNLGRGTQSCGCLQLETMRANGRRVGPTHKGKKYLAKIKQGTAFRKLLQRYKETAARDNRQFTLTENEFRILVLSACFYCGAQPNKSIISRGGETFIYNGIDRKDNALGYTLENSAPCCWPCNELKGDRNSDAFLARVCQIAARHVS